MKNKDLVRWLLNNAPEDANVFVDNDEYARDVVTKDDLYYDAKENEVYINITADTKAELENERS